MSRPTPGPWSAYGAEVRGTENTPKGKGFLIVAKAGTWVEVSGTVSAHVSGDSAFANARLIAAAPDLLEALEALLQPTVTADAYSRVVMAVRKAKGEA